MEVIDTEAHKLIVMEYASGGDLFDYLMGKVEIDEPRAVEIFT